MIAFVLLFLFDRDIDPFFPCAPGLEIAYRSAASDGEMVERVLGHTYAREPRLCVIDRAGSGPWAREHLPDRVSYAGDLDTLLAFRAPMLRRPLIVGSHWHFDRTESVIIGVGRPITVPAGTFSDTIWVEETSEDGRHRDELVYAAGVGLVRHGRGASLMEAVRIVRPTGP